jgi:hypothetical protein
MLLVIREKKDLRIKTKTKINIKNEIPKEKLNIKKNIS